MMTIPMHPGQTAGGDLYLSKDPWTGNSMHDNVATEPLPGVFYYRQGSFVGIEKAEAYVEYWLEATCAAGKAIFPLFVRALAGLDPIDNFYPATSTFRLNVISHEILPNLTNPRGPIDAEKKVTLTPHHSGPPCYAFNVHVHCAWVYQIDHPAPIPLQVWLTPVLNGQVATISEDELSKLPPVELLGVDARLVSHCYTRTKGMISEHEAIERTEHLIGSVKLIPRVIPAVWDHPSRHLGHSSPFEKRKAYPPPIALDLGQILRMHVSHEKNTLQGRPAEPAENNIYASFKTYNVALKYHLQLELRIKCAGIEERVKYYEPMFLRPKSLQQVRQREDELGEEGMRKSYDELWMARLVIEESAMAFVKALLGTL